MWLFVGFHFKQSREFKKTVIKQSHGGQISEFEYLKVTSTRKLFFILYSPNFVVNKYFYLSKK